MKTKTCIKKSLSLIVVLMMLLTMIPVGMISVGAEEATIDLSDYETREEPYVIMNTADWELIANSGKTFEGLVVQLGADIDAGSYTVMEEGVCTSVLRPERFADLSGANMPKREKGDGKAPTSGIEKSRDEYAATFPTLFPEFAGEFDGQGHTIRNARVEEGLIAAITLDGAYIHDVKIVDSQCCDFVDYDDYGLVVGVAKGSLDLENIEIVRGNVPADTYNSIHFNGAGGLIGLADAAEDVQDAMLTIKNCTIDADVSAGGEHGAIGNIHGVGGVVGTIMPNFDFEMTNCAVVGGTIRTYNFTVGAIGLAHVGEGRSFVVQNVKIDGVDYSQYRSVFTGGMMSNGSLLGTLSPRSGAIIDINKVNVTNSYIGKKTLGISGGLIGMIQAADETNQGNFYLDDEAVVGAEINISDIYIADTTVKNSYTNTNQPHYGGAGGLIGQIGEGDSSDAKHATTTQPYGRLYRGDINIYNCYVGATVICELIDGTLNFTPVAYDNGAGGLFGFVSAPTAEIYVSDMIVDVAFPQNVIISRNPDGTPVIGERYAVDHVGVIAYQGHTRANYPVPANWANHGEKYQPGADGFYEIYLSVENVVTTLQEEAYSVVLLNRKGGIHYNGVDIANGDTVGSAPYTDPNLKKVTPKAAKQMVAFDENGFIAAIGGTGIAMPKNVQFTSVDPETNTVDIRFIGLAYVDSVEQAAASIAAINAEGAMTSWTAENIELLDGLTAVENTDLKAFTTKTLGAKKMMAVTLTDVPVEELTFVWAFAYSLDGETTAANETFAGQLVPTDGGAYFQLIDMSEIEGAE